VQTTQTGFDYLLRQSPGAAPVRAKTGHETKNLVSRCLEKNAKMPDFQRIAVFLSLPAKNFTQFDCQSP
jgi:hypothetical protein